MRVAVIGAGIAGLTCASQLRQAGHSVSLFDKGRGPGGRMSTRRLEVEGATLHFDHGAQYFTVRDPEFAAQVDIWHRAGIAARWPDGGDDAWVGTPGMNAPIRAMASDLGAHFGVRVDNVTRAEGIWTLNGADCPSERFDTLVIAVPAEQVGPLVAPFDESLAHLANGIVSDPCWTVMLGFAERIPFEANTIRDAGPIGWAARNSSKPGRLPDECWVVQGNPQWSRDHLEETREAVTSLLIEAFAKAIGTAVPEPVAMSAHRWRYARSGSAGVGHLWNADQRIGVCGDWLIAPRVEAAFRSGSRLAAAILSGNP